MKDYGGIQTFYKDAIVPEPGMSGDNARQENGIPIRDGKQGTSRQMPEVATVTVKDADNPGPMGGKEIKGS